MAKILMVEDSAQLREAVSDFFMNRSGGTLTVETAADGDEGMNAVMNNTYDLVILDIMLPGPSGYMICKKLREKSDCPIVFLTALGTEDNILLGYEMGADEYMVKPFSLMVLYTKCLILMDRKVKKEQRQRQRFPRLLRRNLPLLQRPYIIPLRNLSNPQKTSRVMQHIASFSCIYKKDRPGWEAGEPIY